MIFAELDLDTPYAELHAPLVALLERHFDRVESGLQGDSWVWVFDGDTKVAIDTFTAMRHQVKADAPGALAARVVAVLRSGYPLVEFDPPVGE